MSAVPVIVFAAGATSCEKMVPVTPTTEPVPEVRTVLAVVVNVTKLVLDTLFTVQVPSTDEVPETVILVPTGY
jgi:hypothetical protein